MIIWKFAWATCEGESWDAAFQNGQWVLRLHQTPAQERKCKMERIEIRNEFGGGSQLYEVTGFKLMQDSPNHPEMDCDSMDVR